MLFAMYVAHVTPCALPIHANQHSQHPKKYENQKLGNKMKVIRKIERFNCSRLKDREIDLISRKAWRKTQCESNINTFAEEPVSLKNIGSYRY